MKCPYCFRTFKDLKDVKKHLFEFYCTEYPFNKIDERLTILKILSYNCCDK